MARYKKLIYYCAAGLITIASWLGWPKMRWLIDIDLWLVNHIAYPGLFVLFAALFLALIARDLLPYIARFFLPSDLRDWTERRHGLRDSRQEFWDQIKKAYLEWPASSKQRIEELIQNSGFPNGLPLKKNASEVSFLESLDSGGTELWHLTSDIYPPDTAVASAAIPDSGDFEKFDQARNVLAKFWNDTGDKLLRQKSLSNGDVSGCFPAHASEIKLLTYLEWALHRRLRTKGHGKAYMFKLYRWAEKRKQA